MYLHRSKVHYLEQCHLQVFGCTWVCLHHPHCEGVTVLVTDSAANAALDACTINPGASALLA